VTTEVERATYPLGAPPGIPIPFDIGEPKGLFITSIGSSASALKTLTSTWEVIVLYATVDCVVAFGSDPTLNLTEDTVKTDHQFVPAHSPVTIKLPDYRFKVIRIGAEDGKLYVQNYRRWQALTTEALNSRIG